MESILYPADVKFKPENSKVIATSGDSKTLSCVRIVFNNVVINGMFSLSQLIGYIQFMAFVIIRLIVIGSLAGRLFGDDLNHIDCWINEESNKRININSDAFVDDTTTSSTFDPNSTEIRKMCLNVAYNGSISPLYAWALTLLSAVVPWIVLLPWTPLEATQRYLVCFVPCCRWPCLTLHSLCLIRACIRLILEFTCLICIISAYKMYIPKHVTCIDTAVKCSIKESNEKTCFLWILTTMNLASVFLSVMEVAHIQLRKDNYEVDSKDQHKFTEILINGKSTAQ